jgi:hypothetical protein
LTNNTEKNKKRMRHLAAILLISIMAYGCGNEPKNPTIAVTPKEEQKKFLELPDSLFLLKDQKISFLLKNFDFEEKFKMMDSVQLFKLLGNIPPFNVKGKTHEGYFVSLQNKIQRIRPVIVYGTSENYAALLILNLNEMNQVLSYKEIAGGYCATPVQMEDRIQWCDEKMSTIVNDSLIELVHVHQHSPSYERVNEKYIDSVKYLFKIMPTGKFVQLKKDSTRYYKVVKK